MHTQNTLFGVGGILPNMLRASGMVAPALDVHCRRSCSDSAKLLSELRSTPAVVNWATGGVGTGWSCLLRRTSRDVGSGLGAALLACPALVVRPQPTVPQSSPSPCRTYPCTAGGGGGCWTMDEGATGGRARLRGGAARGPARCGVAVKVGVRPQRSRWGWDAGRREWRRRGGVGFGWGWVVRAYVADSPTSPISPLHMTLGWGIPDSPDK